MLIYEEGAGILSALIVSQEGKDIAIMEETGKLCAGMFCCMPIPAALTVNLGNCVTRIDESCHIGELE